ncbi:hypothetical protein GCM10027418_08200 [Mariniluteicoccus endophyticus]
MDGMRALGARAGVLVESAMDRLGPLWAVASKSPRHPLLGHVGTFAGLAMALLGTAWVIALRRSFTPWDPALSRMRTLAYAAGRIIRDAPAYTKPPRIEAFLESPFAAWAGVLIAGPSSVVPLYSAILWTVLHAVGLWGLCRLLGVRDWRAGFLAAALVNLEVTRTLVSLGDARVLLMLMVTFDLAIPCAGPDETRRWRLWAERVRGAPTAVAAAWDPMLLPFAALLWAARHRRPAVVAGAGFLLLTVAAAVLSPRNTVTYFTQVFPARFQLTKASATAVANQSPLAAYYRWFEVQPAYALRAGLVLLALVGLATAYVLARRGQLLLAIALAGTSPLLAQTLTWSQNHVWTVLGVAALLRGRVPVATRVVGLLAFGWGMAQPWRAIRNWHTAPFELNAVDNLVANFVPVMLALTVVVAAVDVIRLPPGRSFGGTRAEQFFVRGVLSALPWLVALWVAASFLGPKSSLFPWHGAMPDFEVYARTGRDWLNGRDFYDQDGWPFLYPPFAALFTLPMGLGFRDASAMALQLLNALAFSLLFYRAGFRGWQVPFATGGAFLIIQVLGDDLRMGNIHGLIIAMVFLDTVPGSGALKRFLPFSWANRERLLPQGVLTGIATSIKILPGLFIIHMLLTRRYRAAFTALATTAVLSTIGVLAMPSRGLQFAKMVLEGRLNDAIEGPLLHYMSLVSALQRFTGYTPEAHSTATLISYAVGLVAFVASLRWYRAGHEWFGSALCGIATIYLSPVAWNYYYIWLVPAALAVVAPHLDDSVNVPGEGRAARTRHDLPESVAMVTLFVLGWATFQFHLHLGGGNRVEYSYSPIQKVSAGMLPFATALLAVVAAVAQRPWGRQKALEPPAVTADDEGGVRGVAEAETGGIPVVRRT